PYGHHVTRWIFDGSNCNMMNTRMSSSTTSELIAAVSDRLTPTEHRIAKEVLDDPTLLAFGTVSDLSARVGTSRPSIVRFAHKLGFSGYTDLQDHVRSGLSHQLSRPSDRIRRGEPSLLPERAALQVAMDAVLELVDSGQVADLSEAIVAARSVWIVSGETSRAGGYALESGLSMLRPGVQLVGDHTMARQLTDVHADDVAVIFDFYRYRTASVVAAQTLAQGGVDILAVTDGPLSPLAQLADAWCEVVVPPIGPFDSSVPAVAFAELLVAQVARDLHGGATERIDKTESLWETTQTFVT
ncbi:MAG: MurR/RpiR family transcriptional regulator, partial [Acidimicrobiia bacterium]